MKWVERIANIAVIVVVVIFLFVIVRRGLVPSIFQAVTQRTHSTEYLVGKTLQIPGIQLPRQRRTLVLALSTSCIYCNESLPFYQKLAQKEHGEVDLVAVLPQTQEQARLWFGAANVSINQIVSTKLSVLGIVTTPSLLLLDKSGKVIQIWVGRLDQQGQKQVMAQIAP